MTAAMLVLEPIFEVDLPPEQYAYRPGRNAQQAAVEVEERLHRGQGGISSAANARDHGQAEADGERGENTHLQGTSSYRATSRLYRLPGRHSFFGLSRKGQTSVVEDD
jgi:hypothetical protein